MSLENIHRRAIQRQASSHRMINWLLTFSTTRNQRHFGWPGSARALRLFVYEWSVWNIYLGGGEKAAAQCLKGPGYFCHFFILSFASSWLTILPSPTSCRPALIFSRKINRSTNSSRENSSGRDRIVSSTFSLTNILCLLWKDNDKMGENGSDSLIL